MLKKKVLRKNFQNIFVIDINLEVNKQILFEYLELLDIDILRNTILKNNNRIKKILQLQQKNRQYNFFVKSVKFLKH